MKQVLGVELSHHHTPISIREIAALAEEDIISSLKELKKTVEEVFLISTCNRLSLYGYTDNIDLLLEFFNRFGVVQPYLSVFPDTESTVQHFFSTVAGLESQALGEHQILGQVRQSFQIARDAGVIGPVMDEFIRKGIRTGKRVRGETGIGKYPVSLASVAFDLIKKEFTDLSTQNLLLIGTGEMAELTANLLKKSHFNSIDVASRDFQRAKDFAERFQINPVEHQNIYKNFSDYNIIIGATATPLPVYDLAKLSKQDLTKAVMMIDLGVPRNFSEDLDTVDTIILYDLDDIKQITGKGLRKREKEIPKARQIIDKEAGEFYYWLNTRKVTPLIAGLYKELENLKESEFNWALNKLKEPDANHERILERLLHRMVRKFVKNPVEQLKNFSQDNNNTKSPTEVFKSLFDLNNIHIHVPKKKIVVGSRSSQLALIQANMVINQLKKYEPDFTFEIKKIKTSGDYGDMSFIGAFCKEIDSALIHNKIDLAVHSLKDMPTALPEGLHIAAIPPRGDHRDAMLSGSGKRLSELPENATVGTSSLRRAIQINAVRPDIKVVPMRGNMNTRMRKLHDGEMDAIILGAAGLLRLGMLDKATEIYSETEMVPCVGQGALAVEIREFDIYLTDLVKLMDDKKTRMATNAERAYLIELGGGCNMPMGAYAQIDKNGLSMNALLGTDDGKIIKYGNINGHELKAEQLGKQLAKKLTEELQAVLG